MIVIRTIYLLFVVASVSFAEYRTIDGSGNNLLNPNWGKSSELLIAPEGTEYADGYGRVVPGRPNERILSNAFFADDVPPAPYDGFNSVGIPKELRQTGLNPDLIRRNTLSVIFGQFVSHDQSLMELIFSGEGFANNFGIPITEQSDPLYMVLTSGSSTIVRDKLFTRFTRRFPNAENTTLLPVNRNTAWLDMSQVYGNSGTVASSLRTFVDGKLKTGADGFLPFLDETASTNECGIATLLQRPSGSGDPRVDENIYVTAIHSIFFINHNLICDELKQDGFSTNDEELFQKARAINIAIYAHIIYEEYLPETFSVRAVSRYVKNYRGYKPQVNPQVSTAHTIAAFRFGHDQVNLPSYIVHDNCSLVVLPGTQGVPEQERPNCIFETFRRAGAKRVIDGAVHQFAQQTDGKVTDLMRNVIFNIGGISAPGNLDIESANIFRGRENGVLGYYGQRKFWLHDDLYLRPGCHKNPYGSDPLACFKLITSNTTATLLRDLYHNVDRVDAFVGLLLEDKFGGKAYNQGEVTTVIALDQFKRSRDGDRFWYEGNNSGLSQRELARVRSTTMTKLIKKTLDYEVGNRNAFRVPAQNGRNSCHN